MRPIVIAFLLAATGAAAQAPTCSNPVIPGDHPDPSLVRAGSDYWATSTTSQWAPVFPVLHSRDLVNWTLEGSGCAHRACRGRACRICEPVRLDQDRYSPEVVSKPYTRPRA